MHWQEAARLLSWQTALDPHGEGLHGSMISVGIGTEKDALSYLQIHIHMTHTCCYPRAVAEGVASVAGVAGAGWTVAGCATGGVGSTNTRAGVDAFVSNTCLVCWTVVVDCALWLALNVWISKHFREASAGRSTISFVANCIDATWRRIAGIYDLWPRWLSGNSVASAEGISLVSLVADTNRHMVSDSAVSIDATKARARVLAFPVDAGQLLRAVRVDDTLRSAVWWRTNHLWQTGAVASVSNLLGWQRIGATRVGITRIFSNNRLNC